ncbi:MAG: sigma 54-interacting transcriptional regulator [Myxococcota bacterium]|nr:sigma 54-interacting transcriptional regulator [Myxococcota bacterium]
MTELLLIADLVAATAKVHSRRVLVRAIGTTLTRYLPITRVELEGNEWRADGALTGVRQELAPGLFVTARDSLPPFCRAPEFRAALAQVLHAASRHLEVVQRVATLSRRAHADNRVLRASLEHQPELVANSPAMRAVVERASLVARHPTTVLLSGESGTGKEVLARELHRRSQRAHRPMHVINCGAIPEALVESELFGHERGAFTGAERPHVGLFERAHRSTLLLDEIGELPLAAQAKLLRVIQERTIRRVGGEREIAIDVRLIAATNRSLSSMVAAKAFRADLLFRLDVFSISVPPLRERPGDLGPLVTTLVRELASKLGIDPPSTQPWLAHLEAHDWPGNVRELANVLEAALILGELPALPRQALAPFDTAMRATIEASLRSTRGKIYGDDGAAAQLGLRPGTLQSKMKKLGIDRARFVA